MKIAFSTLICPDFSWADIYSMAKGLGFDRIEIRGWERSLPQGTVYRRTIAGAETFATASKFVFLLVVV